MRCKKCKADINKNSRFCQKCGARIQHTGRRVAAVILILAVIAGSVGIVGWKLRLLPFINTDTDISTDGFSLLTDGFTDRKITDQDSALAAIGDVAEQLGIENVSIELSNCREDTIFANTYYRFQQMYQGIPVYGRSVIVAADSNGDSISLSGNYLNARDINTSPIIGEVSAIETAREYYGEDAAIISEGLAVYSLQNQAPELVWKLYVSSDKKAEYCFISAINGNILSQSSLVYTETAIGYGEDIDGGEKETFNTKVKDDKYLLEDVDRNICVYNANNGTLESQHIVVDDKGNIYTYDEHRDAWFDEAGNNVRIVFFNNNAYGDYTVYDSQKNVVGQHAYSTFKLTTKNIITDVYAVTNNSTYWRDKKAVTAMSRAKDVFDFYQDVFKRKGFNNLYGETFVVYNDYKDGDTGNAYSTSLNNNAATLLSFASNNSMSYNAIGHEYTHSVERSISGMEYSGESGALMEAYSDIYAELFEDWKDDSSLNGTCDWIYDNNIRNLVSPANSELPDNYHDRYWADTTPKYNKKGDTTNDYGGVHTNNTVISHAAYLMYNGISGNNPNFEALTMKDLAHLFYETLYKLPSDCTFSQFRTLVQNTADIMWKQGRLSYNKTRCVSNAFFQVGIDPAVTPVSKENLSLDVYDVDGQTYKNYTLYVRQYSGAEKKYDGETVADEKISFPTTGNYELTIEDNANSENRTTVTVRVIDNGGTTELPVFTECGLCKDGTITLPPSGNATPLEAYMEAANRTTATGSWTEDANMTATMDLKKDGSTTKSKATMETSVDIEGWKGTDTSSLYMSGSASMSILDQDIDYTMTWQNGTAHYEYTKPTVTSADLKIDPSYFNFNSLTDDMIISSTMNGNQIAFSIKGDALTKVGVSVVNNFLSGVGNLSYDDAAINVTVNAQSGKIDTMTMTFHASMTYQGYDIEADYEINYAISENAAKTKDDVPADMHEIDYEHLVTDAFTGSFSCTIGSDASEVLPFTVKIPKINLDSEEIESLNKYFYDTLYALYEKSSSAELPESGNILYEWSVKDEVLSLIIRTEIPFTDSIFYDVYNIGILEQKKLSNEEFLQKADLTAEQFDNKLKETLRMYWNKNWGNLGNQYTEFLNETLEKNNTQSSAPFFNDKGELCAVCNLYDPIGIGEYYGLMNLVTGDVCDLFTDPAGSYEQPEEMHQVLSDDEVEAEVLRIRAIFSEQMESCNNNLYERVHMEDGYVAWFEDGELRTITTSPEVTSEDYERIFTYEDGKLIFAYFLDDGKANRLYYKDDNIFRWSYPETTQIQDNNFSNPDFVANGVYGREVGYKLYGLAMGQ